MIASSIYMILLVKESEDLSRESSESGVRDTFEQGEKRE